MPRSQKVCLPSPSQPTTSSTTVTDPQLSSISNERAGRHPPCGGPSQTDGLQPMIGPRLTKSTPRTPELLPRDASKKQTAPPRRRARIGYRPSSISICEHLCHVFESACVSTPRATRCEASWARRAASETRERSEPLSHGRGSEMDLACADSPRACRSIEQTIEPAWTEERGTRASAATAEGPCRPLIVRLKAGSSGAGGLGGGIGGGHSTRSRGCLSPLAPSPLGERPQPPSAPPPPGIISGGAVCPPPPDCCGE
mmetsp:Transcript_38296/g.89636  ORF Transcript_38296/g.89636 Transcript_38296/m.89636 type:complete len:256 (+) Transcript_38296:619-1386(+)